MPDQDVQPTPAVDLNGLVIPTWLIVKEIYLLLPAIIRVNI